MLLIQEGLDNAIFEEPTKANILWSDIKALFKALVADLINKKSKKSVSREHFKLNGVKGFFHRPHPGNITKKLTVEKVRIFLERAGIKP